MEKFEASTVFQTFGKLTGPYRSSTSVTIHWFMTTSPFRLDHQDFWKNPSIVEKFRDISG